jgi:hypothetical protein
MSDEMKEIVHHDQNEDKLVIAHTQDVSGILERNKRAREESESRRMGDMERVACIPDIVVLEWMKEGINVMAPNKEDLKRMKKKLNSPEYAYLRTGGGRL